jgi:hypothetical protein
LESLELHSYEWTVKNIKTRECLDKQDRRDIAVSTFAMSRNRPVLLPYALELRALDLTRETDDTAALRSVARENTRLLQIAAFGEHIEDEDFIGYHSDSIPYMNKVQIFIFGTDEELREHILNTTIVKPLKKDGTYYDDDIIGLTVVPIQKLNFLRNL